MTALKVLAIASEIFPLIKTGGLADVVGALPGALAAENITTITLTPGYPAVLARLEGAEPVRAYDQLFGGPARLLAARAGPLDLFVLDAPHLFTRPDNPYLGPDGRDWPDNALRFAALARVGADIGKGAATSFAPDIVHAHDWQAALAPAYLHYDGAPRPASVLTIHNLAFQGHFAASLLAALQLPPQSLAIEGVEYFGGIGFLKAGLQFADRITTVSPTYAREILTPQFGMALDGLLRHRAHFLHGIVNGIDTAVWNPEDDAHLPQTYNAARIDARAKNKTALQRRMDLKPEAGAPLFGVVSRISGQKGLDLLLGALPALAEQGGQLALLGAGDSNLEEAFAEAARARPGAVGCIFKYDEEIAHLMQAGADFIVVPSRFEPCGLTQLCALRYGATPIVARVGGLADTIIDANEAALSAGVATGLQFSPPAVAPLVNAIERAGALYRDADALRRMRLNGMHADVSWRGPARRYAALYREIAAGGAGAAADAA
jgi:starch synthase